MINLFDPSLRDSTGDPSHNLGDVIIYDAVSDVLDELFPTEEIHRISTHFFPSFEYIKRGKQGKYSFVGGSNLLSSNVPYYNQWKLSNKRAYWLFPPVKNQILLGVGWWQYQNFIGRKARFFYKKVLSKKYFHSVRDSYTKQKLNELGFDNVINTSCPTLWKLKNVPFKRVTRKLNCLFTLTDYNQKRDLDSRFLEVLDVHFEKLYFFAQGAGDLEYVKSLPIYMDITSKLQIVETVDAFNSILKDNNEIEYIGTRLHGGVRALQLGVSSLIISIDNRAKEIHDDTNLPIIERTEIEKLNKWLNFELSFEPFTLPVENINRWKSQFV